MAGIFRKPLWAALEHLYSRLVLPQESSPPTPGSGVDLEGPALSLHNEMALIQKCAMLQLRLGMLLMELEAYQLSQQTADPRRDNSTEKERAQSMRPQAHCGWNQACAFNKAPCLLSFCWCVSELSVRLVSPKASVCIRSAVRCTPHNTCGTSSLSRQKDLDPCPCPGCA